MTVGLNVGQLGRALRSVFIRSGIIVQHRSAGPYRLDGVGDVGQRFVLNVNQVHRFFGDLSVSAATAATGSPT
jgi:hypothetical protein